MSGLLARTRPELVRELRDRGIQIPDRRSTVLVEEKPVPKARWLRIAEDREHGLARDLTGSH